MHHLTEQTRRAYLHAMGVSQWYSRDPLAGASVLVWPLGDEDESGSKAADRSSSVVSAARLMPSEDSRGFASESGIGSEQRTESPKGTQTLAPAQEKADIVSTDEFSIDTVKADVATTESRLTSVSSNAGSWSANMEFIQRWWAGDGWCLVDTRDSKMLPGQQKACDRLMLALAQTLCGKREPTISHRIDWPLFVNRSIRHDLTEAQFYLNQKWDAVQQQSPTTHLLLLGELSPELLGEPLKNNSDIKSFVGPATIELLHLPGKKRQLWRDLQQWLQK